MIIMSEHEYNHLMLCLANWEELYNSELYKFRKELGNKIKIEDELKQAIRGKKKALRQLNKAINNKNKEIKKLEEQNKELIEAVKVISDECYKETGTFIFYNAKSKILTKNTSFWFDPITKEVFKQ